jgi:hypothetical protein
MFLGERSERSVQGARGPALSDTAETLEAEPLRMRYFELPEGDHNTLDELLAEAEGLGINLYAAAGRLRFSAPPGALTADFRDRLSARKVELTRILRGPSYEARGPVHCSPLPFHNVELLHHIRAGAIGSSFTNGTSWIAAVEGPLDVHALTKTFQCLVRDHSVLGARFEKGATSSNLVFNQGLFLETIDISEVPESSRFDTANEHASRLLCKPFDLEKETLFRPFLIKIAPRNHLVGFVIHHIVGDGLSVSLAAKYLWSSYFQIKAGSTKLPDVLALQYSDYVAGLNEWLLGPALRYRRNYWKKQLEMASSAALPADFAIDSAVGGQIAVEPFSIDYKLATSIRRLAASLKTSVFTILLSLNACVLHLRLRGEDVVILVMHDGRDDPSLAGLIGSFQNQLPIRFALSTRMSFRTIVNQCHQTILTAYEKQIPYGYILHQMQDEGVSPNFPEFTFVDSSSQSTLTKHSELSLKPWALRLLPPDTTISSHPFHSMHLVLDAAGIQGHVRYFAPTYHRQTIMSFVSSFCAIAERAIADPESNVLAFVI